MSTLRPYRTPQLEAGLRKGSDAIFNSSSISDILSAIESWGNRRVLLVHSKSLAANTSHISDLCKSLGPLLVDTKQGVGAHSPYADVIDISHRITSNRADCLVCVGSGSYSDACKAARLMAATLPAGFSRTDMDALIDPEVGAAPQSALRKSTLKLILVPTSLSAGEWNWAASCTTPEGKKQHFALDDGCAGDLVLMDPTLARTAPERLWLSSGIRAIDHCVEILVHPRSAEHPDAQQWCEEALAGLAKGLVEYKEGKELGREEELLEGISKCQAGSRMALMGFIVYRIPMGASHAIGHQLGSVAGVMHGITSCVMLPAVLRYTRDRNPAAQAKVVKIFNDAMGWNETEAADAVARLVKTLGLPGTLEEVDVTTDEQIDKIVDKTMSDYWGNGKRQLEKHEIAEIVNSAR